MRYVIFILLFQNFPNCFSQTAVEVKILQTELTRFQAMVQKDTLTLQKLLANDLIYLHSNAMEENKTQHIRAIVSGKLVYQKMDRGAVRIRRYGKIAVTNGSIQVGGLLNNSPFELNLAYTAIYKKHKKTWQLLNWQSTKTP